MQPLQPHRPIRRTALTALAAAPPLPPSPPHRPYRAHHHTALAAAPPQRRDVQSIPFLISFLVMSLGFRLLFFFYLISFPFLPFLHLNYVFLMNRDALSRYHLFSIPSPVLLDRKNVRRSRIKQCSSSLFFFPFYNLCSFPASINNASVAHRQRFLCRYPGYKLYL